MNNKLILLALLTVILTSFSGCVTVVDNTPTTAWLKFTNVNKEEITVGTIKYSMKNISALGVSWNEEVSYGNQTSIKEVTPHSGTFTVTGSIGQPGMGAWESGEWEISEYITAGDTITILLDL